MSLVKMEEEKAEIDDTNLINTFSYLTKDEA